MVATKQLRTVWVVVCNEGHGWEECYDGLWGGDTRIYRTKGEAQAHARRLRAEGDWEVDGEEQTPPEYDVEEWDIADALEDHNLHDDMLNLLAQNGDAAAEAAIAAEVAADELRNELHAAQEAARRKDRLTEEICRSVADVVSGKGSGVHGLALELGSGRVTMDAIDSLPEHSPLRRLAELTVRPLVILAKELNDVLAAKCQFDRAIPCVLGITLDAECVMVYQITASYGPWDGWWTVANLRAALAGGPKEKMTVEAMRAKGVFR